MPLIPVDITSIGREAEPTELEQRAIAAASAAVARVEQLQPEVARLLQHSDPLAFCAGLRWLQAEQRLRGPHFCEWGSGIGLLTALAALNGLDAVGIEADSILVELARETFPPSDQGPRFAQGSFVPRQVAEDFQVVGTYGATIWQPSPNSDPYAELGLACRQIDLLYAYPWPREIGLYEALFEQCASPGALLWLYIQGGAPRLLEKVV